MPVRYVTPNLEVQVSEQLGTLGVCISSKGLLPPGQDASRAKIQHQMSVEASLVPDLIEMLQMFLNDWGPHAMIATSPLTIHKETAMTNDDLAKPQTLPEPGERLMRYFEYAHLPPHLQDVSRKFHELATFIATEIPGCAERTVALRKLLEAKDAAVRARLDPR